EAAGGDHQPGAPGGKLEGGNRVGKVVADGGVPANGDTEGGEAAAEPGAVGIDVLAAGQFAADGKDFGGHGMARRGDGRWLCRRLQGYNHFSPSSSSRKQAPGPFGYRRSRPPSNRAQRSASANPSPTPPAVKSALRPRRKARKIRRRSAAGMPGPRSSTSST